MRQSLRQYELPPGVAGKPVGLGAWGKKVSPVPQGARALRCISFNPCHPPALEAAVDEEIHCQPPRRIGCMAWRLGSEAFCDPGSPGWENKPDPGGRGHAWPP